MRLAEPVMMFMVLATLIGVGTACGDPASTVKTAATSTDVTATCPDVTTAPSNSLPSESRDVIGHFSEECVRGLFGNEFVLPDLEPDWVRTTFGFSTTNPTDLRVFYEPSNGKPRLLFQIFFKTHSLGGDRSVTTPKGRMIRVGRQLLGYFGYWRLGGLSYGLGILTETSDQIAEAIVSAVADRTIDSAQP